MRCVLVLSSIVLAAHGTPSVEAAGNRTLQRRAPAAARQKQEHTWQRSHRGVTARIVHRWIDRARLRGPRAPHLSPAAAGRVRDVLSRAHYWHGTGRYQVATAGSSKYDGVTDATTDVLQRLIADGGLRPFRDPFLEHSGEAKRSISLSRNRPYARAYALFHQEEGVEPAFLDGPPAMWFRGIAVRQVLFDAARGAPLMRFSASSALLNHPNLRWLRQLDRGKRFHVPTMREWISTARREVKNDSAIDILSSSRSDLPGNHAMLFGVKRDGVDELSLGRARGRSAALFEARSGALIRFADMTHVEVPRRNVAATHRQLRRHGIDLPVLALEDVEAFQSTFPAGEVLRGDPSVFATRPASDGQKPAFGAQQVKQSSP